MYHTNTSIMQHFISKLIQSSASCIPSCRYNHAKVSRVEFLGLLYEFMINSDCIVLFLYTHIHLIRWITYNYIKLHVFEDFVYVFVNEWISVGLNGFYAVVLSSVGTTMLTLAILPSVLASHVAQITLRIIETGGHTILAIGLFGAIKRAAAHLGSEVGAGNAEDLLGHNMVNALLQVGNLLFQPCQQPFGNLAQEDTAFAARVKKARLAGTEQFLW